MATSYDLVYDWVSINDLGDAIKIEEQGEQSSLESWLYIHFDVAGYPADEAATLEAFR